MEQRGLYPRQHREYTTDLRRDSVSQGLVGAQMLEQPPSSWIVQWGEHKGGSKWKRGTIREARVENAADEGLRQTLENSSERERLMLETTKTMERRMQVEQKAQICENPAIEDHDQIASMKRRSHRGRQARCKLDEGAQEQTSTNTTQKERSSTALNAKPVRS
ncbi:hypothetical protein V8E53_008697 [Lactarius tabidus]